MKPNKDNGNKIEIKYRLIAVGDRFFCIWDYDLVERNRIFLESIDPKFFDFLADINASILLEEDNFILRHFDKITSAVQKLLGREQYDKDLSAQYSALGVRFAYSVGLETLFAFIAALTQAARSPYAWVRLYRPKELRSLVENIQNNETFPSLLDVDQITWDSISKIVHHYIDVDKTRKEEIQKGFARFWNRLAKDFLSPDFREEYNSIKHGLRIRPGGFSIAIGKTRESGTALKNETLTLLGSSDFGSSYLSFERIGNQNRHIRFYRKSRNWNPEDMIWGLKLISLSITNILSVFKILNGAPAKQVKFSWPTNLEKLQEPWIRTRKLGVTSMAGFKKQMPDRVINAFSTEDMGRLYKEGKDAGIRYIHIND